MQHPPRLLAPGWAILYFDIKCLNPIFSKDYKLQKQDQCYIDVRWDILRPPQGTMTADNPKEGILREYREQTKPENDGVFSWEILVKAISLTPPEWATGWAILYSGKMSEPNSPKGPENIMAASWQNQQNDCAPSEDSDQPGHPPSLIRVFAVRMKKAWVLSYPLSAQRRLWSDWVDAQADLSLCWAHSHIIGFVMRRLIYQSTIHLQILHCLFLRIFFGWQCTVMGTAETS